MIFSNKFKRTDYSKNSRIASMQVGNRIEFENKLWTVRGVYEYRWEDSISLEFELEGIYDKAYLEIELDDEEFTTFLTEISFEYLDEDLASKIKSNNTPKELFFNNETFYLDEISKGTCTNIKTKKTEKTVNIDYYNESEEYLISIEHKDGNNFSAFYGREISENDIIFTNINKF